MLLGAKGACGSYGLVMLSGPFVPSGLCVTAQNKEFLSHAFLTGDSQLAYLCRYQFDNPLSYFGLTKFLFPL